jgi:hypothetical protein
VDINRNTEVTRRARAGAIVAGYDGYVGYVGFSKHSQTAGPTKHFQTMAIKKDFIVIDVLPSAPEASFSSQYILVE